VDFYCPWCHKMVTTVWQADSYPPEPSCPHCQRILAKTCKKCTGDGGIDRYGAYFTCELCDGLGVVIRYRQPVSRRQLELPLGDG
jgi:hypothetical protein